MVSFKFSKQNNQADEDKTPLSEYTAGQFAFFDIGGVNNDPKGPIRHFTISSSPTENFIMFTTRIRDSLYKKRLSTLEKGAKVKVRGPEGQFVLHEDYSKAAVFLSGGIGVTPFRSMIKYARDRQLPLKIVMFDSNRNLTNILFKKEFDDWTAINKNLIIIYTVSEDKHYEHQSTTPNDWKGEYGRINKGMILKYLDNILLNNSIFYIWGPPNMFTPMRSLLQEELKISEERIKVEEFTGYWYNSDKKNKIAEIQLNGKNLFCSLRISFSCFHIQFTITTPRVAKLSISSKAMDNELEVDGHKVNKISNRKRRAQTVKIK